MTLREKLRKYIESCGSQRIAADNIGYSTATISTYLKGTYSGDVDKLEKRLCVQYNQIMSPERRHSYRMR